MKVLGVIPARFASTRLPGKPLIDIGGKPMIRRVYEQVSKASLLHKVIIATDDTRIYDAAQAFGAEVMMTATTHQNGTERCAEVVSKLSEPYDVVINIQGDEPFIDPAQIDTLIGLFSSTDSPIGTLIKACDDKALLEKASIIKVTIDKHGRALYFSRSVIPYLRDNTAPVQYYKHIGIYGFRASVLQTLVALPPSSLELAESLEQLRWLENGYAIQTALTDKESIAIDTAEDLERIKHLI